MDKLTKLPDAEFTVMDVIWEHEPPLTSSQIRELLGGENIWKPQTLFTLLTRLENRGFLRSEKQGKERTYYAVVSREDYLKFETSSFLYKFHHNSVFSLVTTLYQDKELDEEESEKLLRWFEEKGGS
ncbi:BlaI/MecI/CopY family transcriptional regulator [Candidatus Soleaferrea massiliensis]|uniref:BlaI/MecI/CopY family transcriptional regulator n=1 Tax=Candidatus Soleaferrea massiliensis TaxID=1470354 RepID=UPI00058C61D8|nr:BlaI/MecI/CopY family transcriptional regulator [Candidatus Soleaferrea massiliensis]